LRQDGGVRDWFWSAAILLLCFASAVGAAIAPPRVVAVDPAKLPAAAKIATPPVRTLIGYTRRGLHLHDGRTLAVFSYSNSAAANWMFLIDTRDLSSRRIAIPNNDIASHAAALGSDGNVYVMPYHSPRAYRFDVKRDAFEPITVTGLPPDEFTWDAIGGKDDGCIYFGTYPNACVGRYEIATGKTTIWRHVVANTTYVSGFEHDPRGGVRMQAWGPDRVHLRLDATMAKPEAFDPKTAPPATTNPAPATKPAPPTIELAEPSWTERVGDAEITIGHYGTLLRRDLATGNVTRGRVDNLAPGGNSIMFVEAVTPDCIIGANYSQQHLFRVDSATGTVQVSEEMIARTPGEPMCAVALDGRAYLGIYIQSILSVYDPARPFAFGQNPREVGELFRAHKQTRPVVAATDGNLVFFGTEGDYSMLGGALAVIDPKAQQVEAYPQPVKDQNLTSLAYDPKNKLLWGGTNRWGQMRSAPPTQKTAVVFAFDLIKRERVAVLTPWEAVDDVAVLGCTDDGVVVATAHGEVVMIDAATRGVAHRGSWPVAPTRMRRGRDGHLYFLGDGVLWRWITAAGENTIAAAARTGHCSMFTEASPGLWILADATSVYRVRVPDAR
jgi:hypothetical protein